jgi:hypothetical protein
MKAVTNLGDLKASIELLKACAVWGNATMNAIHGQDPERLIHEEAERRVRAEGISEDPMHDMLIDMTHNPVYQQRLEEVGAALRREFGKEG